MFGLVQCFASLFSAFNQNLFVLMLRHLEWRELFTWTGIAGIVLFVLGVLFIRDPAPVAGPGFKQGADRFLRDVLTGILRVAKIGHVWIAAGYGALVFGSLLAAGVVWGPKLMLVRGLAEGTANLAASVLWLGLAVGCIVFPWWSDAVRSRKLPVLTGIAVQLAALLALVYIPQLASEVAMVFWFVFGFGAASHMLAFGAAGVPSGPRKPRARLDLQHSRPLWAGQLSTPSSARPAPGSRRGRDLLQAPLRRRVDTSPGPDVCGNPG